MGQKHMYRARKRADRQRGVRERWDKRTIDTKRRNRVAGREE